MITLWHLKFVGVNVKGETRTKFESQVGRYLGIYLRHVGGDRALNFQDTFQRAWAVMMEQYWISSSRPFRENAQKNVKNTGETNVKSHGHGKRKHQK